MFSKTTWIWILVFLLSTTMQASIWYISFKNANNANALGYISFAGTLISIVLALIAIGYTFGDSISQRQQSGNLIDNIQKLNSVIETITLESEELKKISIISEELKGIKENLTDKVDATHKTVISFEKTIRELGMQNEIDKKIRSTGLEINKEQILKAIIEDRNNVIEAGLLILLKVNNMKFKDSADIYTNVVIKYARETSEEWQKKYINYIPLYIQSALLTTAKILFSLGLLINKSTERSGAEFILSEEMEKAIRNILDEPESRNDFLKEIIQIMKKDLKSS